MILAHLITPPLLDLQLIIDIRLMFEITPTPNITLFSILVKSLIHLIIEGLQLFMRKPASFIIVLVPQKQYYHKMMIV